MEQENKTVATRAEKKDATKQIIRELLEKKNCKSGELIDEASAVFTAKFGGEEVPNDVKGRVGSVIDVMKKEGEIVLKKGVYSLPVLVVKETPPTATVEESGKKEKKVGTTRKKKEENVEIPQPQLEEKTGQEKEESKQEKSKRTRKTAKKSVTEEEKTEEKAQPLPPAPLQPIAPTAPITPESAPEPIPEKKKRVRKAQKEERGEALEKLNKDEVVAVIEPQQETTIQQVTEEEKVEEKPVSTPQGTLMDMSFLFGEIKPKKEVVKRLAPASELKQIPAVAESKTETKPETKSESKAEKKSEEKTLPKRIAVSSVPVRRVASKSQTADERLCEAFLKRIRKLGGEYFEYFSVYLIEKYSRMSGRRLEGLKISGGEHDGGIDGEVELTDRIGFRETIYIQSKNWNPDKGDERLWVVGETLLQQFIGACACRQARDKKQHVRGIFITTSRFTPEAKKVLNDMSDTIVGYDGEDVYETAKECGFGIIKKNGEYVLDENLLSGEKAFFFM